MQDQLKIHLVQLDTQWRAVAKNLANLTELLKDIPQETDLIVLPEMFSTGFDMEPENNCETMQGASVQWMLKTAKEKDCAICGSLSIQENGNYYNRFVFTTAEGAIYTYDKRHLFSYAREDKVYTPGKSQVIFNFKGWKIAPFICYDLRFPVWSRNTTEYDIAIYVANWPETRIQAWETLLKARAIENICYTIGVNRVGTDGNDLNYNGHSQIINPQGNNINKIFNGEEKVIATTLYKAEILSNRANFKFLDDRDNFEIKDLL